MSPGAGADSLDLTYLKQRNILLINCHANANSVAEHAWGLLMAITRHMPELFSDKNIQQGNWPSNKLRMLPSFDLHGKTLGLLGYGNIGRKLADYGKSFGMTVRVCKRTRNVMEDRSSDPVIYTITDLESFLYGLDVLISSLPLTPDTKGIINKKNIQQLKNGIYIVNIGRAEVFDEQALFEILKNGFLGGLAMDAQYNNLRPGQEGPVAFAHYPFYQYKNVILSPHRAFVSPDSTKAISQKLAEYLDLIAENKTGYPLVDYNLGY